MKINDIRNPELRNQLLNLPEGRLRDYYCNFIIYHEKVIQNFETNNYAEMPMRNAVTALCKILFHEVVTEADSFYIDGGPNGKRFALSATADPNCKVFYFSQHSAGYKEKNEVKGFIPGGEILQIGAALAYTMKYDQNDPKYTAFKRVHDTVHKYESNDKEHVCSDCDKAQYPLIGRIADYESFVYYILTTFNNNLKVNLSELISSARKTDYRKLKEGEAAEQLIICERTRSLIDRLNDIVESEYLTPLALFLPSNVNSSLMRALARIHWNLIITFDPEVEKDGHLIDELRKQWDGIHPFKIDDITGDGREETGIILAHGNSLKDVKTKYNEWAKTYKNKVTNALNRIRKGSESIYAVCIPDDDDNKIFNKGGVGLLTDCDTLVIAGKIGPNLEEGLDEDFQIEKEKCNIFNIPVSQVTYAFNEIKVLQHTGEELPGFIFSQEDISRYASYGIKIICPIPSHTEKELHPISEFFSGKDVTEKDLYNDFDVKRNEYDNLRNLIEERVKSGSRFTHYLKHTPSSGATTMAMRLAYDMATLNTKIALNAPVTSIFISEFKTEYTNKIIERIKDLALKVSPNQILAFIDRAIQEGDFERIKKTLTDGGAIKISFIRISQNEGGNQSTYTTQIKDRLSKSEQTDFTRIYRRYASATGDKSSVLWDELKYVIDYPMSLNITDERNFKVDEYIEATLREFNDKNSQLIRRILSLIGLCSEYIVNTDNYVEGFLFDGIIRKRFTDWYQQDLTRIQRTAFERLIKFEEKDNGKRTGRVKTRFSKFNKSIIALSNESLTDLVLRYISLFFSAPKLTEIYVEDYIINMFFKKEDYEEENTDYIGKSAMEKFHKKLSSVFNRIKDTDSISLIFDELGKYIGQHPRYLLSKAQYIYNRAYFADSEEHDSRIFDEARDIIEALLNNENDKNENKSVAFQSLGVLNYRRLGALRKYEIKDEDVIENARQYIENVVRYCDLAYEDNPSDTHSLVTKAQALKSFLNLTKTCLNTENFEFCESDEYVDWVMRYESAVESINGFIVNVDKNNKTATQNELLKIYDDLKSFSLKLIGLSEKELFNHYKSKLESRQISNLHKTMYANRLFNILIEAPKNDIRREKIGMLTDDKLTFIEEQLKNSIRIGNLSGYEKIFRLHLFGRKQYEIDKEIQWLKNWMEKDNTPYSQLWGNYYIGVLYLSKVLCQGYDSKSFYASAKKYRDASKAFAKKLERNDTKEHFYFKIDDGIKCVTESLDKASFMEGRIEKIENNRQGVVILDCGLEATFNPQGKFLLEDVDKHTRVKAKVGFRFSGLGLYGIERTEMAHENNESYILDSSKSAGHYSSPVNNRCSNSDTEPEKSWEADKSHITSRENTSNEDEKYPLEEGYIYSGTYHNEHGRQFITGNWKEKWIEYLSIDGPIDGELYDEADVDFCVKKIIASETGKEKWIAFDVKFPED